MAGHQPNYLPWLGFFDKMRKSDVFIIEDDIQFEYHGYTNRTGIKTSNGSRWLTVPIRGARLHKPINEVHIANEVKNWTKNHWLSLKYNYCKTPHWCEYSDFFEEAYSKKWIKLIDLNLHLLKGLMRFLNITTPLVMASSLGISGRKSELVLAQCKALGATVFFSGTGAKSYLNIERFNEEGIKVVFQNFKHPVYPQHYGEFIQGLSVIDYLFHIGGKLGETAKN